MKNLFKDVLSMEGVNGLLLLSLDGDMIYNDLTADVAAQARRVDWKSFISALDGVRETDVLFEAGRMYIRKTDVGYLLVLMNLTTSVAMLRLNCDILLPSLKPAKSTKKLSRFFKK